MKFLSKLYALPLGPYIREFRKNWREEVLLGIFDLLLNEISFEVLKKPCVNFEQYLDTCQNQLVLRVPLNKIVDCD
jgi:hypothetical protein